MTPEFVESCIGQASEHKSKWIPEILALEGMSSAKIRHLLNNICSRAGTRYLEVGVWIEVVRSWKWSASFNGDCENWWNGPHVAFCAKSATHHERPLRKDLVSLNCHV